MDDKLPIGDALRFGWEGTKKHFWFLLGLYVLVFLIRMGASIGFAFIPHDYEGITIGLNLLIGAAYQVILATGTAAVALKICDGQKPELGDFLREARVLGFYFLTMLLVVSVVMAGFILLIVPGIYVAIRLSLAVYYVVEQNKDPIEAVKSSWEATKGMAGSLFLFGVVVFGLLVAGLLCLILGVIPVWFTTIIASAYLYRVLNQRLAARGSPIPQKEDSTPSPVLVE